MFNLLITQALAHSEEAGETSYHMGGMMDMMSSAGGGWMSFGLGLGTVTWILILAILVLVIVWLVKQIGRK